MTQYTISLIDLPCELIEILFSLINVFELITFSSVCKYIRKIFDKHQSTSKIFLQRKYHHLYNEYLLFHDSIENIFNEKNVCNDSSNEYCKNNRNIDYFTHAPFNRITETIEFENNILMTKNEKYGSSFPSLVFNIAIHSGFFYYEVEILELDIIQIGWVTEEFSPKTMLGHGVGDGRYSYSIDGIRMLKWHQTNFVPCEPFGNRSWKVGDIVGCEYVNGIMNYYLNDEFIGMTYHIAKYIKPIFPAISFANKAKIKINMLNSNGHMKRNCCNIFESWFDIKIFCLSAPEYEGDTKTHITTINDNSLRELFRCMKETTDNQFEFFFRVVSDENNKTNDIMYLIKLLADDIKFDIPEHISGDDIRDLVCDKFIGFHQELRGYLLWLWYIHQKKQNALYATENCEDSILNQIRPRDVYIRNIESTMKIITINSQIDFNTVALENLNPLLLYNYRIWMEIQNPFGTMYNKLYVYMIQNMNIAKGRTNLRQIVQTLYILFKSIYLETVTYEQAIESAGLLCKRKNKEYKYGNKIDLNEIVAIWRYFFVLDIDSSVDIEMDYFTMRDVVIENCVALLYDCNKDIKSYFGLMKLEDLENDLKNIIENDILTTKKYMDFFVTYFWDVYEEMKQKDLVEILQKQIKKHKKSFVRSVIKKIFA